jgi:hypothetical protein
MSAQELQEDLDTMHQKWGALIDALTALNPEVIRVIDGMEPLSHLDEAYHQFQLRKLEIITGQEPGRKQ